MSRLLHLALVQFKPRKGDYRANLARLGEILGQLDALEPRPEVIQLPETALTGYFVEGAVRDLAVTAGTLARDVNDSYVAATGGERGVDLCLGFYEVWRDTLHNSMLYATLGRAGPTVRHVHRKTFLPTYGLFDEERFVERGHEVRAFDCEWGRAAMLVCEDAWHSISGTIAALDGAQVIFISSAAPARGTWPRDDAVPGPASVARWERLVRDIGEEHGVFVSYANLAGSEGGKLFSGSSSVVGPRGDLRARGPVWDESIVALSIDLGDLVRARGDMPLLADLRTALPHLRDNLDAVEAGPAGPPVYDPAPLVAGDASDRPAAAASGADERSSDSDIAVMRVESCHHSLPPSLDLDAALTARWLEHFIREELARRGFERVVLGLSGGVDSAVVAYLAARALGPEHVVGVRLPYRTSSAESLAHAQLVVDAIGIRTHTLDISDAVDGYLRHEPDADATRRGNIMARCFAERSKSAIIRTRAMMLPRRVASASGSCRR